ncbi:hypothetical protein MSAN_01601700 [Mycena sanguinolenta]|uniref:Yeast cell wall synthesis Kre9/Knh1-like N-terminal domain-containing protein n=1 Tax=Mycena sanguinolenta TaxID=230812 RepID=A0A8H7CY52_9AGAR|nr:hypothetical protein MSAN_01601700 [Mycena sanguinolenta]
MSIPLAIQIMRVVLPSVFAAILAVPLASAFTIAVPTNPTSGEVTEIDWTFTATDPPTFDLFLVNSTNAFDLKAIIGENIETDLGKITTLLPTLPAIDGYALTIRDATNVDRVFAWSPTFAIKA